MINLAKLELQPRNQYVYFCNDRLVVYKQDKMIHVADCSGNIRHSVICPPDYRHYDVVSDSSIIVLMIAFKYLFIIEKDLFGVVEHRLPTDKIGMCASRIVLRGNTLLFATLLHGQIQMVSFDIYEANRRCQTSSFRMKGMSDFQCSIGVPWKPDRAAMLMDNTMIASTDVDTCEIQWTRFESSRISTQIAVRGDQTFYVCNDRIKTLNGQGDLVDDVSFPATTISNIAGIDEHLLLFTSGNGKNIGCYNTHQKTKEWEIYGLDIIQDVLVTKGVDTAETRSIAVLRLKDSITVIDIRKGTTLYYIKCDSIFKIKDTEGTVILNNYFGETNLIGGV